MFLLFWKKKTIYFDVLLAVLRILIFDIIEAMMRIRVRIRFPTELDPNSIQIRNETFIERPAFLPTCAIFSELP